MSDTIRLTLPRSAVEGLTIGSIVKVILSGSVTELSESYGDNPGEKPINVCVEGAAEVVPATFNDAAKAAVARISNAKRPSDLPVYGGSQQELHA